MRKCIAMLLSMVLIFTSAPVLCYAEEGTEVVSTNALAMDSPDEDMYQILTGTEEVELDFVNPHRLYFNFPTSGRLALSSEPVYALWGFDESAAYGEQAGALSGMQVSAGTHFLELEDNANYYPDGRVSATITYTFYPNCTVYYVDGKGIKKLLTYEMTEAHNKKQLSTITVKGYTFDGWYTDEKLEQPITQVDTSVGNDWYLYPKCTPIDYSITYDLDGGVNADENPDSCTIEDGIITLMPATKKGYTFVRWYTLSSGAKTTVTDIDSAQCKNVKVYAEWRKNNYAITYEGGYENQNPTIYQVTDGTIKLKDSGRPGYEFMGWYADSSYTEPVETIDCNRAENITIYAKWEPIIYTVSYELNGGINNLENGTEYTVENINEIADPTKDDYDFAGWYLDDEFKMPISEMAEAAVRDVTLYAKWERHPYKITYIDGGTHENPTSYTTADERIVLTDGIRGGYSFEGWYLDEEYTQRVEEIAADQCTDITLYGMWKLNTYYVTYEMDGGFNADGNITEFTVEDIYSTLFEPTKPGCTFSGWYTSPDFSDDSKLERVPTDICSNLTLYAKWEEEDITYQILEQAWKSDSSMGSWDFYLPVDGMIHFSNQNSLYSYWFLLDDMAAVESVSSISQLNGSISAGSHYLEVLGPYAMVSYTFYPKCRVYYVYENQSKELASYYLQSSTERLYLEMPQIKGYRATELYRDRDMTVKIEYVDKSVGKDWYVYPKLELISYPVTYDMDGGKNNEGNITSYTIEDSDFILREPTKEGYVFEGWYDSPSLKTQVTKIITGDCKRLTLYAKWKKETNNVSSSTETSKPSETKPSSETTASNNTSATKKPTLNKSKISMVVGESKSLFVSNATGNVVWNVKNSKIVKLTERGGSGVEFAALFPGKTQITVKVNGVTLKCTVTVKKPTLKYKKMTLKVGKSKKNAMKGVMLGSKTKVKWKSNNKKIATVKNGKIKAKKPGRVRMTATINAYKMNFTVIVKK